MSVLFTRRSVATTLLAAAAGMQFSPIWAATGKKIAVMPKTLINDVFQVSIVEAAEKAAKSLGIQTERYASSSDVAIQDQINTIEALVARDEFGAIILAATDSRGLTNVLRKAKDAGLFVILVDSGVQGDNYVTVIQTDNIAAAKAGADYAAKLIGEKGKVAMLEGEPGGETAAQRTQGFHEGIAKYPGVQLVTSIGGHWTLPGGVEATEAVLAGHKDLDLIFTASDMMGVGARQVLDRAAKKAEGAGDKEQADRFNKVKIVGFDGVAEAVQEIWAGKFSGTVAQRPDIMGQKAVEIAAALMSGQKKPGDFPKRIDSGMVLVTPANVDEYAQTLGVKKA